MAVTYSLSLISVLFVLILLAQSCLPKVISGSIDTKSNWAFVARFCFKNSYGRLKYTFKYPEDYAVQNILLYFDTQWPSVYPEYSMSCRAKEGKLVPKNNQVINLTTSYVWSGCRVEQSNGSSRYLVCNEDRRFLSFRARWWYIVVSNCKSDKGLKLSYSMTLLNGDSFWVKHFSADEQHILEVDIAVLIVFIILLVLGIYVAYELVSRRLFHYTYKLFMLSLFLEVLSLILYVVYYVEYGKSGIEQYMLKVIARAAHSLSHITFMLLLVLLAKGWTVTRGHISASGQIKLSVFVTLYTVCFAILFVFEAAVFDPGKVLYIYESPAGIGICVLRVIAWLWYCYGTFFTLKHFPGKSSFYYPFWFFYTGWFLAGPVIVVIATFVIEKWQREQTVNGIEWAVSILAHLFFLVITRPSAANKNFPYHIRTNQIGIMDPSPTGVHSMQTGHQANGFPPASMNNAYPASMANDYSRNGSYPGGNFTDITSMFMASSTKASAKQHTTTQQNNFRNGFEMSTLNTRPEPSAPPPAYTSTA